MIGRIVPEFLDELTEEVAGPMMHGLNHPRRVAGVRDRRS
jgi:hypothetical protein